MDPVLEYAGELSQLFEKLMRADMNRSAGQKAKWENPTAKMVVANEFWIDVGLTATAKWRKENPEKVIANLTNARAASAQWQEEHPEEISAHFEETKVAMLIGGAKWREEHPKEALTQFKNVRVALAKWRKENPEQSRTSASSGLSALAKWRKEHPEKILANRRKGVAAMLFRGAKWREEHPKETLDNAKNARAALAEWRKVHSDEVTANMARGRETQRKASLETHLKRFCFIKPLITEDGLRLSQLQKLCPQWTKGQLKTFLEKAIKRGDLTRIKINYHDHRYHLT